MSLPTIYELFYTLAITCLALYYSITLYQSQNVSFQPFEARPTYPCRRDSNEWVGHLFYRLVWILLKYFRETEILDVAPVDILHCFGKHFIGSMPDEWTSKELKAQALDFKFHWVSETGKENNSHLTSNISLAPTVCKIYLKGLPFVFAQNFS